MVPEDSTKAPVVTEVKILPEDGNTPAEVSVYVQTPDQPDWSNVVQNKAPENGVVTLPNPEATGRNRFVFGQQIITKLKTSASI